MLSSPTGGVSNSSPTGGVSNSSPTSGVSNSSTSTQLTQQMQSAQVEGSVSSGTSGTPPETAVTGDAAAGGGALVPPGLALGTPDGAMSDDDLPPPPAPCPLMRSVGLHKFNEAMDILEWLRSLGDEIICGMKAKDITVFPAAVFQGPAPSVSWVDVETDDPFDGKSELFDSQNPLHQQLHELWEWFRGED